MTLLWLRKLISFFFSKLTKRKIALITGGAKRIGKAIAITLAKNGIDVALHCNHSSEQAEALCLELQSFGAHAWLFKADFSSNDQLKNLLPQILETTGSLDYLINSASIFPSDNFHNIEISNILENIQINAWAPFVLSREFAKHCETGKIINLLDTRVNKIDTQHLSYLLSKKILLSLTETLAIELAPHFTVNAVAPGLVLPPEGKDHQYLENMARDILLKRPGSPSDVADAVLYLINSNFISGQVLFIDGGERLTEKKHG